MTQSDIIAVLQDAIYTTISASAPMLVVAMVVGLIVSIFQATTQINEQTLAFVPKIVAVLLALLMFFSFIVNTVSAFTIRLYENINIIIG